MKVGLLLTGGGDCPGLERGDSRAVVQRINNEGGLLCRHP